LSPRLHENSAKEEHTYQDTLKPNTTASRVPFTEAL
jgi:hypothetical protein